MKRVLKLAFWLLIVIFLVGSSVTIWWIMSKQATRQGKVEFSGMQEAVSVRYDERGVPHIDAKNEADAYRALGYVQAQDRLFQMEMIRRLAKGQLSEILGPNLLRIDKLMRSLRIDQHASEYATKIDPQSPSAKALKAYLEGVNTYQNTHSAPIEFDLLGIPKRPFTETDTFAVTGYLAYSFAAAFKGAPAMTFIRDKLGPDYLKDFDLQWHSNGVVSEKTSSIDFNNLQQLASVSKEISEIAAMPQYVGSNAWAVSGSRTSSAKPLLAGDPHIGFAAPAVWYEAHLRYPGYELYGHFQPLTPYALLGHNMQSGWSLTMFENDDLDLIAEKVNPENPNQVSYHGQWVDLSEREDIINVKGAEPVKIKLRTSPHGPIINDVLSTKPSDGAPIAMWWAFLEYPNLILEAFYDLPRAETLEKARNAVSKIDAPGLNVVWANSTGDIAWWAVAKIPKRPEGVNPLFILDGDKSESDKLGSYDFSYNPQEENPSRGFVASANHQPVSPKGIEIPGYYLPKDRISRIHELLDSNDVKWNTQNMQTVQLDVTNHYPTRLVQTLLPLIRQSAAGTKDAALVDKLAAWNGVYKRDAIEPTISFQFTYELVHELMFERLGKDYFDGLLGTFLIDPALERMVANPQSVWWSNPAAVESKPDTSTNAVVDARFEKVHKAWIATMNHLRKTLGDDPSTWSWGRAHTLTHRHPLGVQKPLDKFFNVGPFPVNGSHETINNLSTHFGPAPWAVDVGPSTRRIIDFAKPEAALGINPVGQSGVLFDSHYSDQAYSYANGQYVPEHFSESDVAQSTIETLILRPAH